MWCRITQYKYSKKHTYIYNSYPDQDLLNHYFLNKYVS